MSTSNAEHPRRKLRRAIDDGPKLNSEPVLIRVGAANETFHVHKDLLRANSAFFNTALKKQWKEGQDGGVDIPDTEIEPFTIWVKWLYTGHVYLVKEGDVTEVNGRSCNGEWARWRKCYALGEFLQDLNFKDACIDTLIEVMQELKRVPFKPSTCIYEHSTSRSQHRKLAVDVFVRAVSRKSWGCASKLPREFLLDVITTIGPEVESGIRRQSVKDYFDLNDTCKYHDHGSEKPCYKTKSVIRS